MIFLNLSVIDDFFREDIFEKFILCKKEDNNIKHVINQYIKLKELRDILMKELDKEIDILSTLNK